MSVDSLSIVVINGLFCMLHKGHAVGLGEFIRNWQQKKDPLYEKDLAAIHVNVMEEVANIFNNRIRGKGLSARAYSVHNPCDVVCKKILWS